MKHFFLVVFLLISGIANAQEQSSECEAFLATPVGELSTAEIVRNCGKFAICGVDSQDMFNCVTPQVMGMLVFEAKEEDEKFTYGTLLDKLHDYVAKPSYISFKKKQTELIKLLTIKATPENWSTATSVLLQNGYSSEDVQNLRKIYDSNPNDPWTFGDLMEYYNVLSAQQE